MHQRSRGSFRIPDQPSSPRTSDRNPPSPGPQFTKHTTTSKELAGFQVAGETGWISHQLLVARPASGPGLASTLIATVTPSLPAPNVDSAIAVLSIIARETDTLIRGADRLRPASATTVQDRAVAPVLLPSPDTDVPYRISPDGRAFPALDQVDPSTTSTAPAPPPPTEPAADRRR
jgi:hypothetical protein